MSEAEMETSPDTSAHREVRMQKAFAVTDSRSIDNPKVRALETVYPQGDTQFLSKTRAAELTPDSSLRDYPLTEFPWDADHATGLHLGEG
ncbi:hypothetical protein AV530_014467 [Patagioenas fasciata monilis]|uniref:Uncharacterized protein n=1 Tax=Patagioenas fasciata monilis TaxID=372326 RepID=A0A1V4KBT6_PATFA|nr:hypothetical protein AV530_014467 [Patagioenas fasciata monilis]